MKDTGISLIIQSEICNQKSEISQRWFVILTASLCFVASVIAGEKEDRGFEIVSHNARICIFPSSSGLNCIDTLSIRRTAKGIKEIKLNLVPFYNIEKIIVNGEKIKVKRNKEVITLDELNSDSLVQVIIYYSGTFRFRSEFSQLTNDRAILRAEEILPYGPNAFQNIRLCLTVPNNWETIAVGQLIAKNTLADSTIFVWEYKEPIPTVGWICAGKFWDKQINENGYSMSVHLFEEDSSAASGIFQVAQNVLKFYSKRFTPFRFPKLDIVEVEDWVAGKNVLAIASPSVIMVKKQAFTTHDEFNQAASILAHEIAHQWWPLTVFIEDQDAAFLSEGMCEYSARLYDESVGAMTFRDSLQHHPLLRPLMMRIQQAKDVPLQQKADLRSMPTQYLKASYVHNMLRYIIGDSAFAQLYREYAKRYAMRKVSLLDFQKLAEELSSKNLDWFFDQWVKKKGVPKLKIYNVKSKQHDGRWLTQGRVRMVGYDKYTTPIDVGIQAPDTTLSTKVWLGADSLGVYHNDVPFEIVSGEKPLRVLLDPHGDILKIQKLPPKLADLREPADGLMIIGTLLHRDHLLHLAQRDSAEMDKGGWSITIKFDSSVTLSDLQNERVFLYGKVSENRVVADLGKKFPYGFLGDSVEIKGERIFDSTLALIQVIENPFMPQGLMSWIAPLSQRAEPELLPYDASWVLLKGKDEISLDMWEAKDEDLVVEVK